MVRLHSRNAVLLPAHPPAACCVPASSHPHHKPLSRVSQSGFDGDPAARYRCFSSSSRPVLHGKQQVPNTHQVSKSSGSGWGATPQGGAAALGAARSLKSQGCPPAAAHPPACSISLQALTVWPCSLTAPSSPAGRPRPPTARGHCSRRRRRLNRSCTLETLSASADRTALQQKEKMQEMCWFGVRAAVFANCQVQWRLQCGNAATARCCRCRAVRHPCTPAALVVQSAHLPPLALAALPPSRSPCSQRNHWFRRPKMTCPIRRAEMFRDAAGAV